MTTLNDSITIERIEKQNTINKIISFAIEIEKNSILLYNELLSHNLFADSKQMLKNIITEEKSHIVILSRLFNKYR